MQRVIVFFLAIIVVSAGVAVVLGLGYDFLFSASMSRGRPVAETASSAMRTSVFLVVITIIAAVAPMIAFLLRVGLTGKIIAASVAGGFVALVSWFLFLSAGGFPIFAGVVVGAAFLLLLAFDRGRTGAGSAEVPRTDEPGGPERM